MSKHGDIIREAFVASDSYTKAKRDRAIIALDTLEEALEAISDLHDGDIVVDGNESDACIFAWADDFVAAHAIARAITRDSDE